MRTQVFRTAALGGLAGAGLLVMLGSAVQAQTISSDQTAGYVLFPKILSDPEDAFNQGQATETVIQLTNTDNEDRWIHCFYVNATGQCVSGLNALGETDCRSNSDCLIPNGTAPPLPGSCNTAIWGERNFTILLTPEQPIGWRAAQGRLVDVPDPNDNDPNTPGAGFGNIPTVPTTYFQGELKCFEVDSFESATPINSNHLKGEATIYVTAEDPNDPNDTTVDVRRYNAIGIQTILDDGSVQNDQTLCLGATEGGVCATAEYAACPARLILNHLFAGAYAPEIDADPSVTLVPCTQRIAQQEATSVTVQMLVFNEFEQRFSLGTQVECYADINLRELSILYAIGTQGTIAGQTVFRPVPSGDPTLGGFGILGIAEQGSNIGSTAYNIVYNGMNPGVADIVTLFPEAAEEAGD